MLSKEKFPYHADKNKSVLFFSASSVKDAKQLYDFGIREILVSYHYISKSKAYYDTTLLPTLKEEGGLFMTDSGAFSFMAGDPTPEQQTEEYWKPYLESYLEFIHLNYKNIYCVANLDLDKVIGREIVDRWNEDYFKPIEKLTQVVYVAHKDPYDYYGDKSGLKRVEEYAKKFDYFGVNQGFRDDALKVYNIAKRYKRRVHGFAWTSLPVLKSYPLFSCDSTTWLGGVRYGTTYDYDGKNFSVLDYKKKHIRNKPGKVLCETFGIDHKKLVKEKREQVNDFNLIGWLGFRKEYLKFANIKLWNKNVRDYFIGADKT